jgi:hypothetical protein
MFEIPEEFRPVIDTALVDRDENTNDTRYDVSIPDLVEADLLQDGEKLAMEWKPRSGDRKVFDGTILSNSEIEVFGKPFASPSYAAVYALQSAGSNRKTENGWVKWKNSDGKLLSELRERYIETRRQSGNAE